MCLPDLELRVYISLHLKAKHSHVSNTSWLRPLRGQHRQYSSTSSHQIPNVKHIFESKWFSFQWPYKLDYKEPRKCLLTQSSFKTINLHFLCWERGQSVPFLHLVVLWSKTAESHWLMKRICESRFKLQVFIPTKQCTSLFHLAPPCLWLRWWWYGAECISFNQIKWKLKKFLYFSCLAPFHDIPWILWPIGSLLDCLRNIQRKTGEQCSRDREE